jgi:hypothetical protein
MCNAIIAETPAPRQPRWKECAGTERACRGVVATGLFCAVCAPANGAPAPRKVTLPKPSRRETYAAGCCRLTHQGLLNGARALAMGHTTQEELWAVTSQRGEGGYTVSHNLIAGTWACGCDAASNGTLCAHVALARTWPTECPVCAATLIVYADRAGLDRPDYAGAVRCTGVCGLIADLTEDEAEALHEARLGIHTLPILGLLLHVAARVGRQEASAA